MGRLYDKKDLSFNLDFWNRQEQLLHIDIAHGRIPASILDHIITESRDHKGLPCGKSCGCRSYRIREGFELERKRERMKLLRTGSLLRELDAWQKLFKACPNCHQAPKRGGGLKDVPCVAHAEGLTKAKSAIWWAGEHNLEERNARGQRRAEGIVTAKEALEGLPESTGNGGLNKWESQYMRDKAEGAWPLTAGEQKLYDVSNNYEGFLDKLRQDEEMTEDEYLSELRRLREQAREVEESAIAWAGGRLANGLRRQKETFQKDSRHTRISSGYTNLGQQ